jgi:SAM-dependent methyltransferase
MNTAKMRVVRAPRNEAAGWAVDRLRVRRGHRVLAIGLDAEGLEYLASRVGWGLVVAVHGIEAMPDVSYDFERAIAVDAVRVWDNPVAALRKLRDLLEPGGRVALALDLPRVSDRVARRRGIDLLVALTDAGFADGYIEMRETPTGFAVCVLARS